jgi:hypothetical protein
VHKIQAGLKITPLSQWGKELTPAEVKIDTTQVDTMSAAKFFAYAAELLKLHPPHITDEPIIARLKRVGFEPGKSFDLDKADPAVKKGFESVPEDAQALIQWNDSCPRRELLVAEHRHHGRLRQLLSEARHHHPTGPGGKPASGCYLSAQSWRLGGQAARRRQHLHHPFRQRSNPAGASLLVDHYDNDGFQVANPLNRFAVSSWMPFKYNADGSLDLYFQNESPGPDKEANWLPAPKGPYNLTMRLYAPKSEALTGKWNPPPVTKVEMAPLTAQ